MLIHPHRINKAKDKIIFFSRASDRTHYNEKVGCELK
jgi:hypothetical protein